MKGKENAEDEYSDSWQCCVSSEAEMGVPDVAGSPKQEPALRSSWLTLLFFASAFALAFVISVRVNGSAAEHWRSRA